ncbi:hypothetical protein MAR_008955 [Mya arenaria]|uniref:Uncharacterized protein n=1 Tax=Mya arenaria TaxID=6604 RepID=A0ABY7E0P2_MYAAR|nr:hypothetical protein MAR_008955 [Mya arenaria]
MQDVKFEGYRPDTEERNNANSPPRFFKAVVISTTTPCLKRKSEQCAKSDRLTTIDEVTVDTTLYGKPVNTILYGKHLVQGAGAVDHYLESDNCMAVEMAFVFVVDVGNTSTIPDKSHAANNNTIIYNTFHHCHIHKSNNIIDATTDEGLQLVMLPLSFGPRKDSLMEMEPVRILGKSFNLGEDHEKLGASTGHAVCGSGKMLGLGESVRPELCVWRHPVKPFCGSDKARKHKASILIIVGSSMLLTFSCHDVGWMAHGYHLQAAPAPLPRRWLISRTFQVLVGPGAWLKKEMADTHVIAHSNFSLTQDYFETVNDVALGDSGFKAPPKNTVDMKTPSSQPEEEHFCTCQLTIDPALSTDGRSPVSVLHTDIFSQCREAAPFMTFNLEFFTGTSSSDVSVDDVFCQQWKLLNEMNIN